MKYKDYKQRMKMEKFSGKLSIKQIRQKARNKELKEMRDWSDEMKKSILFRARIKAEYRQNFVRILNEKMENRKRNGNENTSISGS